MGHCFKRSERERLSRTQHRTNSKSTPFSEYEIRSNELLPFADSPGWHRKPFAKPISIHDENPIEMELNAMQSEAVAVAVSALDICTGIVPRSCLLKFSPAG